MSRVRRVLFSVAAATGLLAGVPSVPAGAHEGPGPVQQLIATAEDLLDLATYTVRTELSLPGGESTVRTQQAVIGVPALVEVHGSIVPVPDLIVTVLPSPSGALLEVVRSPLALGALPVKVEAVFDLPGEGDRRVAFGYDQRAGRAPTRFSAIIELSVFDPSKDDYELTVAPVGSGSSLVVTGELFAQDGDGERVDPRSGRFELSPVPARTTVGLTVESTPPAAPPAGPVDVVTVVVDPSSSTAARVRATEGRGELERVVDVTVAALPDRATVVYTDEELDTAPAPTARRRVIDYTATGPVDRVDFSITEATDDVVDRTIVGGVEGVPASFHADLSQSESVDGAGVPIESMVLDWSAATTIPAVDVTVNDFTAGVLTGAAEVHAADVPSDLLLTGDRTGVDDPATPRDERPAALELTAPAGSVGSVEAGVASDGPVRFLEPEPFFDEAELAGAAPAYAFVHQTGGAFRVAGVREASIDTADPVEVHLLADRQRLLVRHVDASRAMSAKVMDMPARLDVTVQRPDDDTFTATYDASGTIDRTEVFVTDVADRATADAGALDAHIDDIPARMTIARTDTGFEIDVPDDRRTVGVRERVTSAEVLVTEERRDEPAADGTLETAFITPAGRLLPDEDGVAIETTDTDRRVYGRVRNLTSATLATDETFLPVPGYRDDQTFQPQVPKPLDTVPRAGNTFDLADTMAVAVGRTDRGPLGVRAHDAVTGEYFEGRLVAPRGVVALTVADHQKRVDSGNRCVPASGANCDEFAADCSPLSDEYCESVFSLDYEASGRSGPLTIDTNSGDRQNLFLEAPSLPDEVSFCVATDGSCTGYAKDVNVVNMSARFEASEEMQGLVVEDCVEDRPGTPECERGGVGLDDELGAQDDEDNTGKDDFEYLTADFERVRFLELEMSVPPIKGGLVGHVFVNTTDRREGDPSGTHRVDGKVRMRALTFDPSGCGPAGGKLKRSHAFFDDVTADQRFATIQIQNNTIPPFTFPCLATGVSVPNLNGPDQGVMSCAIPQTSFDLKPNFQVLGAGEVANELCGTGAHRGRR